jgi:hypothetical protein
MPCFDGRDTPAPARWRLALVPDLGRDPENSRPGCIAVFKRGNSTWEGHVALFLRVVGDYIDRHQLDQRDLYQFQSGRAGLGLVTSPELARLDMQPEICAAFWTWKSLNAQADAGDFDGLVKIWNGGTNGLADRPSDGR